MVRTRRTGTRGGCTRALVLLVAVMWPACHGTPAAAQEAQPRPSYGLGWFESAARAGDPEAQYQLGSILDHGATIEGVEGEPGITVKADPVAAKRWYEAAAAQGHAKAQFSLGLLYQSGRLGEIDLASAERWYRAAAKQGLPQAMYNLAVILAHRGGDSALTKAANLYRDAAEHGFGPAAYELGLLYRDGNGVEADPVEAYVWLERAVRLGVQAAKRVRDDLGSWLSPAQLAEAKERLG
jgi:TPR repeat protein